MKALTIKEPYATLIRNGVKTIETRSWKTNYRGPLYIHAGVSKEYLRDKELMRLVKDNDVHLGEFVCKCNLIDCVRMTDEFIKQVKQNELEYATGFYEVGRYAWILRDVEPVKSDKVKGHLGIWTCEEGTK